MPKSPIQNTHTHTHSHLRFLVPCTIFSSPSDSTACCQSLLSRFTLGYWLLRCTSSHVLLFSREHHQTSENVLFWFGVYLQLQKNRRKLSYIECSGKQATWKMSHWTSLEWSTLFCCDCREFCILKVHHLCTGWVRHGQLSTLPLCLLPLAQKSHLSGLSIRHSEANAFARHRHGSVQFIITTLWLHQSYFSRNAQMYQLLLLYNENRWETGDKPCL